MLINGVRFEVSGACPTWAAATTCGSITRAYIPFEVMAANFPLKGENHQNSISFIEYQPHVTSEHLIARKMCTRLWRAITGSMSSDENAFDEWDSIQESKMVGTIFDVMNMFLGAVGMVTLALGAIGVINIMLVAVSERTQEIGLRKALGATNRSILFHFFLEGLLLTLGSGMLGMAFAGGLMAIDGWSAGAAGIRSTEAGADVGDARDWQSDVGWSGRRACIRRAKRPCCSRWKRCGRR